MGKSICFENKMIKSKCLAGQSCACLVWEVRNWHILELDGQPDNLAKTVNIRFNVRP